MSCPSPIVFHFNNPKWRGLQSGIMDRVRGIGRRRADFGAIGGTPGLEIITCNSREAPSLTQLWLREMGIPFHWLGRGIRDWTNSRKLALCAEFLARTTAHHVLHLDADDVLMVASPAEVLDRFRARGCDMLFGAEVIFFYHDCHGFGRGALARTGYEICHEQRAQYLGESAARRSTACLCRLHRRARLHNLRLYLNAWRNGFPQGWPRTDRYTFLNAGCWIGSTGFLREAFGELEELFNRFGRHWRDQPYMHLLHRRRFPRIRIDASCSIFQCGALCHEEDFFLPGPPPLQAAPA